MNILKAILFGIIEGITEWIPISSTAHMRILNLFLPLDVSREFYGVFEALIQFAAILALILVYFNKIWPFGPSGNPLGEGILANVKKDKIILWLKIIVACIPVILFEVLLGDLLRFVNEKNEMIFIAVAFILIGAILIAAEVMRKGKGFTISSTRQITFLQAFIIGLTQVVAAVFPGVSRLASTIIAALFLGICRPAAIEFSYELAIPVAIGACIMEIVKLSAAVSFYEIATMLTGCVFAFAVSLFMIRYVLSYIRRNTFMIFGIYRILMGIVILIFLR